MIPVKVSQVKCLARLPATDAAGGTDINTPRAAPPAFSDAVATMAAVVAGAAIAPTDLRQAAELQSQLEQRFGITHTTVQIDAANGGQGSTHENSPARPPAAG
jgi:hypothetical protein